MAHSQEDEIREDQQPCQRAALARHPPHQHIRHQRCEDAMTDLVAKWIVKEHEARYCAEEVAH